MQRLPIIPYARANSYSLVYAEASNCSTCKSYQLFSMQRLPVILYADIAEITSYSLCRGDQLFSMQTLQRLPFILYAEVTNYSLCRHCRGYQLLSMQRLPIILYADIAEVTSYSLRHLCNVGKKPLPLTSL